MSRRVYLDNAATTPVRQEVLEAMLPFLTSNFGNPSSIHQEGRTTRAAIEGARKLVASLIGASTGEIFFTSGGTESNNMAIKCSVYHIDSVTDDYEPRAFTASTPSSTRFIKYRQTKIHIIHKSFIHKMRQSLINIKTIFTIGITKC